LFNCEVSLIICWLYYSEINLNASVKSVEFNNDQADYAAFVSQTKSLIDDAKPRLTSCSFQQPDDNTFIVSKKGSEYFLIINYIYLCVGKIDQRKGMLFGFFARIIARSKERKIANQIASEMN